MNTLVAFEKIAELSRHGVSEIEGRRPQLATLASSGVAEERGAGWMLLP